MLPLPDPPADLAAAPRAFYDELREMLEIVRPTDLDTEHVTLAGDHDGGLELTLPHVRHADWSIVADIGPAGGIVFAGPAHEHFDAEEEDDDRTWSSQAVDFIAELLRGEFEIESVFRGPTLIRIRHYVRDEDGRHSIGMTGLLRPAALMFWRPTRTEITRIDFAAHG